jgi:hypothetical protein
MLDKSAFPFFFDWVAFDVAIVGTEPRIYMTAPGGLGSGKILRTGLLGLLTADVYELRQEGRPLWFANEPTGDELYLVNGGSDILWGMGISRAKVDGSQAEVLLEYNWDFEGDTITLEYPTALGVDIEEESLYWIHQRYVTVKDVTQKTQFLRRSDLNAQSIEDLFIMPFGGGGLALDLTVPGDTNGDGDVDLGDFESLKEHFGGGVKRSQGDLNGDHQVDLNDFDVLKSNLGADAAVPEPEGLVLLALGFAALAVIYGQRFQ